MRFLPFPSGCLIMVALSLSVLACHSGDVLTSRTTARSITGLPRSLTAQEAQLVATNNEFAFALFKAVAESAGPDANVFISPLSVDIILGMAYNGAAGITQAQLQQVLGLSGMSLDQANNSYQSLIALLLQLDPTVTFALGNSVWYAQGYTPSPDFTNATRTYFGATVQELNFGSPSAPATIDQWVNNITHGRITNIAPEPIPPNTVVMLANAIYFDGKWATRFDPAQTTPAKFGLRTGDTTTVQMMSHAVPGWLAGDQGTTIAELPYGGGAFRMTIVSPQEPNGLDSLVPTLTSGKWSGWVALLNSALLDLHMPKFTIVYGRPLDDVLSSLGAPTVFCQSGNSDFGNMGPGTLCISTVMHKAFVNVDESGTEAAGASSAGDIDLCYTCFPSVVINHPFLFIIRERFSGTILFIGRVMDPAMTST